MNKPDSLRFSSLIVRRWDLGGLGILLLAALAFVVMRVEPLAPANVTVQPAQSAVVSPALLGIAIGNVRRGYVIQPIDAKRVFDHVGVAMKTGQLRHFNLNNLGENNVGHH